MEDTGISQFLEEYSVTSDTNKVWVHTKNGCIARLCGISMEFLKPCGLELDIVVFRKISRSKEWDEIWTRFCLEVGKRFGIRVEDKHKPDLIKYAFSLTPIIQECYLRERG